MLLPPFTDGDEVNARHGMSNEGVVASTQVFYGRVIPPATEGFFSP
jgi:hypothetical protein